MRITDPKPSTAPNNLRVAGTEPETNTVILSMKKPTNPLSRGFASAGELSTNFTSYNRSIYDHWARTGKIKKYKFKDDKNASYFHVKEVLENTEQDRLTELGDTFQDFITTAEKENNGKVNYNKLYTQAKSMITEAQEEPEGPEALAEEPETKQAPQQEPKVATEEPEQAKVETLPQTQNKRPLSMFHGSSVKISPIKLEFNVTIETNDSELLFEAAALLERINDLKRRSIETMDNN